MRAIVSLIMLELGLVAYYMIRMQMIKIKILFSAIFLAIWSIADGCNPSATHNCENNKNNEQISGNKFQGYRSAKSVTDFIDELLNRVQIDHNAQYDRLRNLLDDYQVDYNHAFDNLLTHFIPHVYEAFGPNETFQFVRRTDLLVQFMNRIRDNAANRNSHEEQETTFEEDGDTDKEQDAIPEQPIKVVHLVNHQTNDDESSSDESVTDYEEEQDNEDQDSDDELDANNDDDDQDGDKKDGDDDKDKKDSDDDEDKKEDVDDEDKNDGDDNGKKEDEKNEEDETKEKEKKDKEDKDEDEEIDTDVEKKQKEQEEKTETN